MFPSDSENTHLEMYPKELIRKAYKCMCFIMTIIETLETTWMPSSRGLLNLWHSIHLMTIT